MNEEQFQEFMNEIDNDLKIKNVPIIARQIEAIREAAIKLKIDLPIVSVKKAIAGVYSGESLAAHILKWFDDKYGDRLKINFSIGYVILLIRNDPYKLKIPLIFGKGQFIFDKKGKKYPNMKILDSNKTPKKIIINVYELISGITSKLISELNKQDEKNIMQFLQKSFNALYRLDEYKELPYRKEAKLDLATAVNIIMQDNINYGQSKWASLQLIEKIIKGVLSINKIGFKKSHNLTYLSDLLIENNLCEINKKEIENINCVAGVRYGEINITQQDAIIAHHSSINLINEILKRKFDHFKNEKT